MLLIKMEDYFGIALRAKPMAVFSERGAQFTKIVDLPIKYDPKCLILIRKWWICPLLQINDRKPPLAEPDVRSRVRPTRIRAAVNNGRAHPQNHGFRHNRTAELDLAGYSAH